MHLRLRHAARAALLMLTLTAGAMMVPAGTMPAAADEEDNAHLTPIQRADLERVNQYLNGLTTLKGRFIQVSDGGEGQARQATGNFYIRKPGRMRFEYDAPVPVLFIADGTLVSIEDKELETVNSYPLSATPLKLLLQKETDLIDEAQISRVERREGFLFVTARKDGGIAEGELTMVFEMAPDALNLIEWTVVDAQQITTRVILRDVEHGMKLSAALFVATDYDFEDVRD